VSNIRTYCLLSGFVLLACHEASAQTTTRDGVMAIVRGDYDAAARILRPLAEEAPQPDPLAQFIVAMLYGSGQGAAMDPIQACPLFLRAARSPNPFTNQALNLAHALQNKSPALASLCAAMSADSYRSLPPTSIALGRNHSVVVSSGGVTVDFNGTRRHTTMLVGGVGWTFLPVRHVELAACRPAGAVRHFIEFFAWSPDETSDQPAWKLGWMVFEIVGADLLAVTSEPNLLASSSPPPAGALDVDRIAQVRCAENGEAEWAILTSPARSAVIPMVMPQ
jgi:hypothetical protein